MIDGELLMRKQNKSFIYENRSNLILLAIVVVLALILSAKTFEYLQQVTIVTPKTALRSGPGIEYSSKSTLKKEQRVTIIRRKYHWIYIKDASNKLGWIADWNVAKKYRNKISSVSDATIVIDPGHGGADSGALSTTGKMEKTYTLKVARKVIAKLRAKGAKVYMTRDSNKYVGLAARAELSNKVHADAFISFHFDSSPVANDASGVTTYYYHQKLSYRLAKTINSEFNTLSLDNRGIDVGNFQVIRDNEFPAILLEMGYINSDRDFAQIKSNSYQNTISSDVVTSLTKYFEN
ncbi:N-acetylmuramoyl-L-alanine amidase [Liquorilactobacillus mali]|uniref:N-acetylmuramoyl-L-alanine amidase n=2 Tax=Liquorilactobacillus mali TaxID=1618 RepID=A0A0R2FYT6_9LACO|nr:N-acetylmuramoyl-L-alanine amidase [Liquorilactobacillus mali]